MNNLKLAAQIMFGQIYTKKGALDVSEMPEELICELSRNDVIIDAVMMPPPQSDETSAQINENADTMTVEKPSKFKNRIELFKSMLQLFKYTNEKNHLMEKEMAKLFGFAKSFLESSNSILNANKTKQRRHKKELATVIVMVIGVICVVIFLILILYNCLAAKTL
uniref:Uncharacterized protein n=1 Tax=Globodera pallida TaxID=36090 RepID=A0A183CEK2_GLOPA